MIADRSALEPPAIVTSTSVAAESSSDSPLRPLLEGVERARKLSIWTLLALLAGTAVSWTWAERIFAFLARPLTRELAVRGLDSRLAFTHLADPFILYFTVSLFGGLLLALPILLGQLFVIVSPRIRRRRALAMVAFVVVATLLFLAGMVFCYEILVPFAVAYLLDLGAEFQQTITVRDFLRFIIRLLIALGFAAQLPLVAFVTARVGLVSARLLWKGLPYAVLVAFILSAWITPPDGLSQILVAVPLVGLYLVGVLVAWLARRSR